MADIVYYEKKQETAWVYLNSPKTLNALSKEMFSELIKIFTELKDDKQTKLVVITGKGKAFCAGANLKQVLAEAKDKESDEQGFMDLGQQCFQLLYHFPKPVIAALNGITAAGGLEVALAADIIIAAETAKIGDAHANFGVLPGGGSSIKLARKIGENRAKYLLFSGDFISAQEMKEYGLVYSIVPLEELGAEVTALTEKLAKKSPLVLSKMKRLVNDGYDQPFDIALNHEMTSLKEHLHSHDLKEGLTAFQEKRNPEFRGY